MGQRNRRHRSVGRGGAGKHVELDAVVSRWIGADRSRGGARPGWGSICPVRTGLRMLRPLIVVLVSELVALFPQAQERRRQVRNRRSGLPERSVSRTTALSPPERSAPSCRRLAPQIGVRTIRADSLTTLILSASQSADDIMTGLCHADVDNRWRTDLFDTAVVASAGAEIVEKSFTASQQDRHDRNMKFID